MTLDQVLLAVAVLGGLGWYLSFSASRLDRLHHRIEGARSALDAQLVRRAEAALELATSGLLDPATGLLVAGTAADALAAEDGPARDLEASTDGGRDARRAASAQDPALDADLDPEPVPQREGAESDLSRALQVALDALTVEDLRESARGRVLLDRLASACHRVQLARRFLNDAVVAARRVRAKRVVRWARLAGRAPAPATVELDDEPPAALVR